MPYVPVRSPTIKLDQAPEETAKALKPLFSGYSLQLQIAGASPRRKLNFDAFIYIFSHPRRNEAFRQNLRFQAYRLQITDRRRDTTQEIEFFGEQIYILLATP